jgi:hypothetical protein
LSAGKQAYTALDRETVNLREYRHDPTGGSSWVEKYPASSLLISEISSLNLHLTMSSQTVAPPIVCKSSSSLRNGTTPLEELVERLNIGWNRRRRKGEKNVREDRFYKLPKAAQEKAREQVIG